MTDKPTPEQIQQEVGMTRDEAMMVFRDAISAGQVLAPFAGEEAAATVIQQAFAEREERLADHVAVHRAMLQGHIAKPSPANIWHLYQRDLLDAMPDEFKAERDGEMRVALAPIMDWYQSDEHEPRKLADIAADAVADLQSDRADSLRDRGDAARYRWLRDESCPPHNFYVSVPDEFKGVRYSRADVDAYIDEARQALAAKGDSRG